MKNKSLWVGMTSALGMLVLILDSKTALLGAQEGIQLCLSVVIPSLFPFFLLSMLLTQGLMGMQLRGISLLRRGLGIPKGGDALVLTSFLGGYPAGAQAVAQCYKRGQLHKESAQQLLPLCNQPGPAFLFGMVAFLFPKGWMVWLLWGCLILSALLTAQCVSPCQEILAPTSAEDLAPFQTLTAAMKAMGAVCGWVVLFRMLLSFLSQWFLWMLPEPVQILLAGLLELSNGCLQLGEVGDVRLRFCIAAGCLAFGGVCVTMQTFSVTQGLSHKTYYLGKGLQTLFALLLAVTVCYGIWIPLGVAVLVLFLKKQKKSSIPGTVGV